MSVFIIHWHCVEVSNARAQLAKKKICVKRILDYFPKKYPEYANNRVKKLVIYYNITSGSVNFTVRVLSLYFHPKLIPLKRGVLLTGRALQYSVIRRIYFYTGGGGGWHLACIGPEEVGQQLAKIHGTNFDAFWSFRSKSF